MENFELIEKYLMGQMTSEETLQFEERLSQDAGLQAEKESLETMILGVESLHLKERLSKRRIGGNTKNDQGPISTKESSPTEESKVVEMQTKASFSIQKLAIAASFIVLCLCGWWLLGPSLGTNDQIDQLFGTDPGLPTPMSETTNYNFYDGMVEFKMENYNKALSQWNNSQGTIGSDTLDYYIGIALLKQMKLKEASEQLKRIPQESELSEKAKWYLLSALIKQDKFDEAKMAIKTMSASTHPKIEEVKAFLDNK